ncbi:unnamed protein product, partial [Meganyctiphanes norvegica]
MFIHLVLFLVISTRKTIYASPTKFSPINNFYEGEFQEMMKISPQNITNLACEAACNGTENCSKQWVDADGDCHLYQWQDKPLLQPDCTSPFLPLGQQCFLVVENEEASWEEAH